MKKFDVYEALKNEGFAETVNEFGCTELTRKFEKEIEVAWHGTMTKVFEIVVEFNPDRSVLRAYYYSGGSCDPFKAKTHLNEKRAYNAIHMTAKYNDFAF